MENVPRPPGLSAHLPHLPVLLLFALPAIAQRPSQPASGSVAVTPLAIGSRDRRAPTAGDLALIRAGAHSGDALTVRMAVRALDAWSGRS